MMKFLSTMLLLLAGTSVVAQAGSDSIAGAEAITLPFAEVIDNSTFTAEAVDYCSEEPAGDFFTPIRLHKMKASTSEPPGTIRKSTYMILRLRAQNVSTHKMTII